MIAVSTHIELPRCILRIQSQDDASCMVEAFAYPGFTDGLMYDHPLALDEVLKDINFQRERWINGVGYYFSILKKEGVCIGRIGIVNFSKIGWMINYWIHPLHQGQGFAQEAVKGIIQFASMIPATQIYADVYLWNEKSKKVLEANGFRSLGQHEDKERFLYQMNNS